MMSLTKRLDLIEPKILDKKFRTNRGTANEVNFWIFDYDAEDEMAVRAHIDNLVRSVNGSRDDVQIVCFDLYKMVIDILREKNYLDKIKQMEQSKGSSAVIEPIKRTLRLNEDDNLIINRITEKLTPERDIIFLTGIGKAFPIIRSHTILNKLHSKVENNPLIMFFPGDYTDELRLFGAISDGNYYRAFKLIER